MAEPATIIMPTLDIVRATATLTMARKTAGVPVAAFTYWDTEPRGAVRTSNALFKAALDLGASYIVYLNDDVRPEQTDWLKLMIAALEMNDRWGFASPSGECSTVPQRNGRPGDPFKPQVIDKPMAWFVAVIKRQCLLDVGVFDPAFIHYGDESDWIQRAFHKGWKQVWTQGVYIQHLRGGGNTDGAGLAAKRLAWARHDKRLYRRKWVNKGGKKHD